MLTNIHGKFMYNTSGSDSIHGQGRYGSKKHLPAGRT